MKILVISDTHIPRVAHDLPDKIYEEIPNVDMIIHAGDFVEKEIYNKLKKLKPIKAVFGNMDSSDLRNILNQKEVIEIEKVRIGLVHGHGAPSDLVDTVRGQFSDVDAIVFGHSHAALNIKKNDVLFFNPGSPTDNIFAKSNSYGVLEVSGKKIEGRIIKL